MEIAGLKLWQAVTVVVLAGASSLSAPSPGFAAGSMMGVGGILWLLALTLRRVTPQ